MSSRMTIGVVVAALALVGSQVEAGPLDKITVVSVTSNAFNNGSTAWNLIDGDLCTTMNGYYGVDIPYPYVEFDFGAAYDVGEMKVANYIRAENYYNNRGWEDVEVSYSPDATTPFTLLDTYTFVRGYDGINCSDPEADFQSSIDLGGITAQRIRWDVQTTYAPASVPIPLNTEWAVAEAEFYEAAGAPIPEPATLVLMTAGLGLVLRRRRRRA